MDKFICEKCGNMDEEKFMAILDSCAVACRNCGSVYVDGKIASSLQEWAKDLYEADKPK